jgi:hypothetical protein
MIDVILFYLPPSTFREASPGHYFSKLLILSVFHFIISLLFLTISFRLISPHFIVTGAHYGHITAECR